MAQFFLSFTLLPRIRHWEGALARLLQEDQRKIHYFEFAVDALVKADIAARFEAYSKAIASRVLSPNDVRAKENLPPYKGGDTYENPNTSTTSKPTMIGK